MTNFNEFAVSASMAESKAIIIVNGKQFPAKIKNITHNGHTDSFSSPETLIEAEVYDRTPYNQLLNSIYGSHSHPYYPCIPTRNSTPNVPAIKDVIFHDPATIVFWTDGTKTVVKVQEGEVFDPEKGLAMAMCKKLAGKNKGNFNEIFKKWVPETEEKKEKEDDLTLDELKNTTFIEPVEEDTSLVTYGTNTILTQFLDTHREYPIANIIHYRRALTHRNAINVSIDNGDEILYIYDENLDKKR